MITHIRDATFQDGEAIARIYNHYVVGSAATFDTEPVSAESRREWVTNRDGKHPVLVAERDGDVVGWGSISPWASRPAWHRTVETSVYVREDVRGEGVGSAIMEALIDRARAVGHHVLIAQIVAGNDASVAMGERMGFVQVGTLCEVGDKFGRWHDLVLAQLILE